MNKILLGMGMAVACLMSCTDNEEPITENTGTGNVYFTHEGVAVSDGNGLAELTMDWPSGSLVAVTVTQNDGNLGEISLVSPSINGVYIPAQDARVSEIRSWYGYYPGQTLDKDGNRTSLIEPMVYPDDEPSYSFFGVQTDENLHQFYLMVSDPEERNNTTGHLGNQKVIASDDVQMHFVPLMTMLRLHVRLSDDYTGDGTITEWGVSGSQVWTRGCMDLKRGYLKPDRKSNESKTLTRAVKDGAAHLSVGKNWSSDMVIHPVQLNDEGTFIIYAIIDGKRFEWSLKNRGLQEIEPGHMVEFTATIE